MYLQDFRSTLYIDYLPKMKVIVATIKAFFLFTDDFSMKEHSNNLIQFSLLVIYIE
jgi:hypothetical protein